MTRSHRRTALWAVCPVLLARIVAAAPAATGPAAGFALPGLDAAPVRVSTTAAKTEEAPLIKSTAAPVELGLYSAERYSLKIPKGWWGPLTHAHGVKFILPKTRVSLTVTFHREDAGTWSSPTAYRGHMRSQGTISDSHLLSVVKIADRFASRAQYTSVVYGQKKLYTDTQVLYYNEELMIPDPDGLYVFHFKAPKNEFLRHRGAYLEFIDSLALTGPPGYRPEKFYLDRADSIEDLKSAELSIGRRSYIPIDVHEGESYQFGLLLGPAGLSVRGEGLPGKTYKGGGGSLRFMYYLTDRLGLGAEGTYQRYLKEKANPTNSPAGTFSYEFQSWITALVMRINPWGKRRTWTPYMIGSYGSHVTHLLYKLSPDPKFACGALDACKGMTLTAKGAAWSAGLGFEKRVHKYYNLTLEGRYRALRFSNADFPGTGRSFSFFVGSHVKWGHFRHTEHDVVKTRKALGLVDKPERRGRRSRLGDKLQYRGPLSRFFRSPPEKGGTDLPGFDEKAKIPRNPHFKYRVPVGWKGPLDIPGGVRYGSPGGLAAVSIAYHPKASGEWEEPEAARRRMRDAGTISDRHIVEPVMLSGRFASRARYTTQRYRGGELLGEKVESFYTEELFSPGPAGNYRIRYRAQRDAFNRYRPDYLAFLMSLELPKDPHYKPGAYYRGRDHLLKDLYERELNVANVQEFRKNLLYDKQFQFGAIDDKFGTLGLSLFGAFANDWSAGIYTDLLASGDFKTTAGRLRWHARDAMSSGVYLFFDLGRVTTEFAPPAGGVVTESKTKAWQPMAGIGYLWLWRRYFVDIGGGIGPPATFKQNVTPPGSETLSEKRMRMTTIYLNGGIRFGL